MGQYELHFLNHFFYYIQLVNLDRNYLKNKI